MLQHDVITARTLCKTGRPLGGGRRAHPLSVVGAGHQRSTIARSTADPDATLTARSMTREGMLVGSVPYMSPEQAEGKQYPISEAKRFAVLKGASKKKAKLP